ncbi:hypothetical protein K505DRAFT_365008 [Melanomma pulvis-pyrius CBS 109.77]|uniref:Uncharacterized protein n=1 Tax=Melanomma pulvis-pyrius CBS 109.77 TaxID=1314802 RepID=A0A6A6X1V7_9PLEO|nr:hypothetical protein K505DRAFT_365008 [Melanomma pulvis-pyrius CBS 109.77]
MPRLLDPRYYFQETRLFYQHQQQVFRHVLGLATAFHQASAVAHLFGDKFMSRPSLIGLDILAVLLSAGSRIVWIPLFKDPEQLWGFHRPEKSYHWAVCGTAAAAIIPALVVNSLILLKSWEYRFGFNVGFWHSVLQLLLWVGVSCLCLWMVWSFLTSKDEGIYEPVTSLTSGDTIVDTVGPYSDADTVEPYSDTDTMEPYSDTPTPPTSRTLGSSNPGLLSAAYGKQRSEGLFRGQTSGDNMSEATNAPDAAEVPSQPEPSNLPHCPTVARYDYIAQSRVGPHSWIAMPLVALFLGLYSAFFFAMSATFIYENNLARVPYKKAKGLLYLPLAGLLLCLYATKHKLRHSLFAHHQMPLPEPWTEVSSMLKHPKFKDSDTGELSKTDPRLRAFPERATGRNTPLQSFAYISSYNANASTCTTYWGHLGRQWKSDFRARPVIYRLNFLLFSLILFARGWWSMFAFSATKFLKHHNQLPDLTVEDLERVIRIFRLQMIMTVAFLPIALFVIFYTLIAAMSLVVFWGKSALAYGERTEPESEEPSS